MYRRHKEQENQTESNQHLRISQFLWVFDGIAGNLKTIQASKKKHGILVYYLFYNNCEIKKNIKVEIKIRSKMLNMPTIPPILTITYGRSEVMGTQNKKPFSPLVSHPITSIYAKFSSNA